MTDGFAALDSMIARIEAIPGLARRAAPDAADAVREELDRTIAAGTTPDGKPWKRRKDDGGKPLATAARAVKVAAIGPRVLIAISGHVGRHHKGIAKGGVPRQVIPVAGIPAPMADKIREVLVDHFNTTVRP